MMRIEHDIVVQVPSHGAIFDALMNANLLMQVATALPPEWWPAAGIYNKEPWPVYGIYDDTGDWLEVWIKSEEQWEKERV